MSLALMDSPGMRKRLERALMATPAIATLLFLTPRLEAATNSPITATTYDSGRKLHVSAASVAKSRRGETKPGPLTFSSLANGLVYSTTTGHRSKPVPHANVRSARSAAAVDQYLDRRDGFQNSSPLSGFSEKEIDAAIDEVASRHRWVRTWRGLSGTLASCLKSAIQIKA